MTGLPVSASADHQERDALGSVGHAVVGHETCLSKEPAHDRMSTVPSLVFRQKTDG
jgi:hypothetical protein